MEHRRATVLCLLWILGTAYAQDFYVVAPSALRLNYEETIGIAYDGGSAVTATVKIQDYPRKKQTIFEKNVQVEPGTQLFKVNLNSAHQNADFLSDPKSIVSLNVRIKNVQREILLPISSQSGYMFIQSTKPIYNPRERAAFRITPLTEDGVPSTERFKFQIKNPQGVIVDEKIFNERKKQEKYFGDPSYTFPKFPILGEWKAFVHYGKNLTANSSISFYLKEYVLPTFTVKLETPDVILPNSDGITVKIIAKYVYQKDVYGVVTMRLGVKRAENSDVVYFAIYNPATLQDGEHTARISTEHLKKHEKIGWFPQIEGFILVVEATVVDKATGKKVVETDTSTRFSKSPFIISFKRCLTDFKPGLPSIFEADITNFKGDPAARVPVKISAIADNKQMKLKRSEELSNARGVVSFEIQPENKHRTITLTLETNDPTYGENQAKGVFIQRAYESKSNAYIAISRMSPLRLEPGDTFSRDVHFEPKGIKNIYYVVVARGKIVSMDKFDVKDVKVLRMEFRVTYDMTPSFRIVVFAHYGNDFIADSLKIEVDRICNPGAEVHLDPIFELNTPGSGGKIVIKGTKGTAVGLLGVDSAVYALSKKDILTRENMFDKLESHDLGCGPGGGKDINAVLGNAGITIGTNKFTPSPDHSCVVIKRKKRSSVLNLMAQYEGLDYTCCGIGLLNDPFDRDCRSKSEDVRLEDREAMPNCTEIAYECCIRAKEMNLTGWVFPGSGKVLGNGNDNFIILHPDEEDRLEQATTVRRDFREVLINLDLTIGQMGKEEVGMSLPHSITTWVVQAVSVNPTHGICVAEPKEIKSFKNLFIQLNIPYSLKLLEQVEIELTVFNYGKEKTQVDIYMYGVEGLCSEIESGRKSERKYIYIDAESAETVTFPIVPLRDDDFVVTFVALSDVGRDRVEKTLHVVPQGYREERNLQLRLDPTNRQKREKRHIEDEYFSDLIDPTQNLQITALKLSLPNNTVPGTARCSITATGDLIGNSIETTLNNPDKLIQKPSGCGEQNLVHLAPTIYTMRYLEAANKLTPEREKKGMEFIRFGYDNELKFKKGDGSYSVWAHTPTSTWLTAFVVKVFCQATEFFPIDNHVIASGLGWLVRNQNADGSFVEKNLIYHREMMGGVDGTVSMTAFALIALAECDSADQNVVVAKNRAVAYLEDHVLNTHTPLPTAVLAYALALGGSNKKKIVNDRLLSMAKRDSGNNYLYWTTKSSAQDIETAGYGLLTQLLYDDLTTSSSIVNWLNRKQLKSGEFKSTQDTVIALQSLSEFSIRAKEPTVNLVSNITASHNASFHEVFRFNKDNALDVQEITLADAEGTIFVNTAGDGMGTLSMNLRYNVMKSEAEICKFDINITQTEVPLLNELVRGAQKELEVEPERRRRREASNNFPDFLEFKDIKIRHKRQKNEKKKDYALKINICVKYLGNEDAGMSIVDVGIFSGFVPLENQLKELVKDPKHLIQRFDVSKNDVVFYLDKIPVKEFYCFEFEVHREYLVGNVQASTIKVYDYYNPDEACTKFYRPDKKSALLAKICDKGVCRCLEGGCSPDDPFEKFSGNEITQYRREDIKKMFCDDFDYVWKGRLNGRMRKNAGLLNISFEVEEVIKPGVEAKDDLEGKTRTMRAQIHCETVQLLSGASYLVVGKDPPAQEVNGKIQYIYMLDRNSIVYHLALDDDKTNEQLMDDLKAVMEDLKKEEGCGK